MNFKKFGGQTLSFVEKTACVLLHVAKTIALALCFVFVIAAIVVLYNAGMNLTQLNLNTSIQDGLFVMILLEMLYVIFSFLKYGSINVSLVINIGMIATIKELIFKLNSIDLMSAIAFTTLIVGLGIGYVIEMIVFEKKKAKQ